MSKIETTLGKLFDRHRIVFWYDEKRELREEYESLSLPEVEKIELEDNEFSVKYRVLRQETKQKFLLYRDGPQPPDLENWLLDVKLAHGEFRADQVSLWLSELGLGLEFKDVVQEHEEFYKAASRREALREKLEPDDTPSAIRMKMLAVCANAGAHSRLEDILERLLDELAEGRDARMRLIGRCALGEFLWERMERAFGYRSSSPSVRDFTITLFDSCYKMDLGEPAPLNSEALVFLNRWKDSVRYHPAFEKLSSECAGILNIEADLQKREVSALVEMDYFRLIDQKILSQLVHQVVERTISPAECEQIIWRRRTTHWFDEFKHIYEAVDVGSKFIADLNQSQLEIQSLSDGVQKYIQTWHRLDQRYRKFVFHTRASRQVSLLGRLVEQIENLYSNKFLLVINDRWQRVLDESASWEAAPLESQRKFYEVFVQEYLRDNKKIVVVISDALRYEIAEELMERVESEDRYAAQLEAMLAVLPSYTQLCMAALLPHQTLTIHENGTVYVDGQSSVGIENRSKILANAVPGGAAAIRSDELLAMDRDESRALFRDHQVLYVYHNQIDAVGDKRDTEERVFDVVEEALQELVDIIKKLANANVTNMLVTADHGFIYQHTPIDESEFAGVDAQGEDIWLRDRRFVVGKGLRENPSLKRFDPADMGLDGDLEIMIPKSINRLRLQGAGSRYVHGGASLQEIVLPVLRVNKRRESDIEKIEVDIITGPTSIISTGQVSVSFYQNQPVSSKVQGRRLRAGIYTQEGELISDRHDLNFDLTSENPRDREVKARFVLGQKADQANDQEVILKLEEHVPDTSHYREYKSVRYILRRSFTSDFDL